MSFTLNALKKAIAKFEFLQKCFAKYGAQDTESDTIFQEKLLEAFNTSVPSIPSSAEEWALYDKRDADIAAELLGDTASDIVNMIGDYSDDTELFEYVRNYCWRLSERDP